MNSSDTRGELYCVRPQKTIIKVKDPYHTHILRLLLAALTQMIYAIGSHTVLSGNKDPLLSPALKISVSFRPCGLKVMTRSNPSCGDGKDIGD